MPSNKPVTVEIPGAGSIRWGACAGCEGYRQLHQRHPVLGPMCAACWDRPAIRRLLEINREEREFEKRGYGA